MQRSYLLDRPLLGMKWREQYYVDTALPFGLRSAPYIFTAIADMVQWMLTSHHGVDFLRHYLDDFLTLGPPASSVCYNNLQACIQLCSKLGLPLHSDKLEGPSTCLSILGIEVDSGYRCGFPLTRENASSLYWSPDLANDSARGGN